jgi:hypothetical protein
MHNIKISLAVHLFMILFWLADSALVVMLVTDWEELDPTAHFKTFVARIVTGAFEW